MAGSYNHCVDAVGNLLGAKHLADALENGGDVFEAVEELYGMVWFLAWQVDSPRQVDETVERARQRYTDGLDIARRVNGAS